LQYGSHSCGSRKLLKQALKRTRSICLRAF
jgi:hypothetical protein